VHYKGMIYGHARVSTDAEDLPNQVAQLKGAGCSRIFREKISGATAERPQFKKLMAKLAASDVVVIPAVDLLSRDTIDLARGRADANTKGVVFGRKTLSHPISSVRHANGST
jgi:DNA invertase Pin-like site-specific DNA recombinase